MTYRFKKRIKMRKSIITIIAFTLTFLVSNKAEAQQDPNFTLYNFNMNIINPAYAGTKDSPELNLVYRSQFLGIDDAPRTVSMAYSKNVGRNLGIGISLINDKVFILKQTDVAVDISYKIKLSEQTKLYFGLKAGGGFTNIDLTRAYDGGDDPLFLENQDFFNPHVGAGIHVQNEKFYITVSTPNFLKGKRYEKQGNAPTVAIDNSHFYLGTGVNLSLSENLMVTPMFMMRNVEGVPNSYDMGAAFDIHKKVIIGMNYRVKEMISSYTLLDVSDKLKFGVAYDVTMSDLYLVDQRGSIEFIFKYQF
jgi:type IX secretion system PorP/SprF family membrane protein